MMNQSLSLERKQELMRLAMDEAEKAIKKGNPPFGALLINSAGEVLLSANNTQIEDHDPTAHAEIKLEIRFSADESSFEKLP